MNATKSDKGGNVLFWNTRYVRVFGESGGTLKPWHRIGKCNCFTLIFGFFICIFCFNAYRHRMEVLLGDILKTTKQ